MRKLLRLLVVAVLAAALTSLIVAPAFAGGTPAHSGAKITTSPPDTHHPWWWWVWWWKHHCHHYPPGGHHGNCHWAPGKPGSPGTGVLQPHQNAAATVPQSGITVGEMFAVLGVGMAALALFRRRRSRTLPRGPDS